MGRNGRVWISAEVPGTFFRTLEPLRQKGFRKRVKTRQGGDEKSAILLDFTEKSPAPRY